jgi:uncharacterized membrane protein SpoIIM required for sporulation
MTEDRFVEERSPRWKELGDLVRRAGGRAATLSGEEVRRLGALYRAATTDLALARTLGVSEATLRHVNRLCVAAHDLVYAGRDVERAGSTRFVRFLASGFPALVRKTWRWHAFAAAAVIVPGVVSFFLLRDDPDLAERTLGTVFQQRAERVAAASDDARRYLEVPDLWLPVLSWGIVANNVRVTLIGFALGTTFGVGSTILLAAQGVNLGGGLAVFHHAGVAGVLWTFVAAHGPLELTAIFISCGAGTRLGLSLLLPGRRSRGAAFRDAALESVGLLLGTSLMLVAAGLLEGFLSPSDAPPPVKWAVGGATAAFLAWYFAFAGRAGPSHGTPAAHPA